MVERSRAAMIAVFTDFGPGGPYTGQMKAVLHREAPAVPVVELLADAPAFDPRPSAYLLPAYAQPFPAGSIFLVVIDPGVGGDRLPLALEADGRWFVGPDNGVFEMVMRRAFRLSLRRIPAQGRTLSASFHGRDLFAPAAAELARSGTLAGAEPVAASRFPDWPDDLAEVVYVDRYGNLVTGLRASVLPRSTHLAIAGRDCAFARTFSEAPPGEPFWYENSAGLAEIAVSRASAAERLGAGVGEAIDLLAGG